MRLGHTQAACRVLALASTGLQSVSIFSNHSSAAVSGHGFQTQKYLHKTVGLPVSSMALIEANRSVIYLIVAFSS